MTIMIPLYQCPWLLLEGCTIVEMATGEPPFRMMSGQAAMFQVGYFKKHPEIPAELTKECIEFTKKCFEPNPELRLTCDDLLKVGDYVADSN